jgi:hypothetical protein
MESEPKARVHHRKRRERAQKLQLDLSDSEGEKIGDDQSPLRGSKERSRSKPRKKKSPGTYEEDFIDGFAIISFKTKEELQVWCTCCAICVELNFINYECFSCVSCVREFKSACYCKSV